MKKTICGLTIALGLISNVNSYAQTTESELTATILHLDSSFWKTYNSCDTINMRKYFTEDLEFYHDKGGPSFGMSPMISTFARNLCNGGFRVRREAVAGTLKVYPMWKNDELYGAILSGDHYFYVTEKGQAEKRTGFARFTHLWLKQDGVWKMSRILSYDHGAAQ
ncbi:MAG: nuclear transport factor 2 family protein [Pseudobacter sp.]|uniref:nuclear transport factor 2 family protein n=1 Tax=Pseudobacter sp. TaxID=2045420 RepID=UPI003F7FD20E